MSQRATIGAKSAFILQKRVASTIIWVNFNDVAGRVFETPDLLPYTLCSNTLGTPYEIEQIIKQIKC